ncbi:uncharacterized protein LOC133799492 [Humulus lupulus]|uniref:uncharacterized protein LOC133799492 n=1 Tax=Humulus lupulus TaxID=3486 RepID=UPI002B403242|nr:uncharacterized protein LOC133799492 [Humulus lupulus]
MVSRNYRPSMEKSSIDLNHETSSTSVSETQPEHGVEGSENVVLHNEDESRHKGSNNDFNMLNQSPLFTDILQGQALRVEFTINGTQYNNGYYLAYGIYPEWGTFVKTIPLPQGEKRKLFARCQEAVRKDIERAFKVLQSHFAIVRGPTRFWQINVLKDIMYACIILHNIIVEDKRDAYESLFDFNYDDGPADTLMVKVLHGPISDFSTMLQRNAEIRDRNIHHYLHADLVEHIW